MSIFADALCARARIETAWKVVSVDEVFDALCARARFETPKRRQILVSIPDALCAKARIKTVNAIKAKKYGKVCPLCGGRN